MFLCIKLIFFNSDDLFACKVTDFDVFRDNTGFINSDIGSIFFPAKVSSCTRSVNKLIGATGRKLVIVGDLSTEDHPCTAVLLI
ncbi:hypothetical protein D3C85_840670 [compost metagenome]